MGGLLSSDSPPRNHHKTFVALLQQSDFSYRVFIIKKAWLQFGQLVLLTFKIQRRLSVDHNHCQVIEDYRSLTHLSRCTHTSNHDNSQSFWCYQVASYSHWNIPVTDYKLSKQEDNDWTQLLQGTHATIEKNAQQHTVWYWYLLYDCTFSVNS